MFLTSGLRTKWNRASSVEPQPDSSDTPAMSTTEGDTITEPEPTEHVEQLLLTIREVFVYKLPPLTSSAGYRAEQWDLANPMITGVLQVYQKDLELYLRVFEPKRKQDDVMVLGLADMDLELFAECPIKLDESKGKNLSVFFDGVIDSSRYFVIRCQDRNSSRAAFVGIGFRDRQCSFDLKATLQDFKRYTDRAKAAERLKARAMGLPEEPISGAPVALEEDEPEWEAPPSAEHEGYSMAGAGKEPPRPPVAALGDLRLKEGEKIKLNLRAFEGQRKGSKAHGEAGGAEGAMASFLPPPPGGAKASGGEKGAAAVTIPPPPSMVSPAKAPGQGEEDDSWGDFTSG